jgi:hypothetical protein
MSQIYSILTSWFTVLNNKKIKAQIDTINTTIFRNGKNIKTYHWRVQEQACARPINELKLRIHRIIQKYLPRINMRMRIAKYNQIL